MSVTCPEGHSSQSLDYCDICGTPLAPDPAAGAPGPAPGAGAGAAPDPAPAAPDPGSAVPPAAVPPTAVPPTAVPPVAVPPPAGGPGATEQLTAAHTCPECGTPASPDALFCESCGFDFTTGVPARRPDPAPAAVVPPPASGVSVPPPLRTTAPDQGLPAAEPLAGPVEWVAEVWVDPAWLAVQETTHNPPSGGPPTVVPLRGRTLLIGRPSASLHITPDIDCSADPGVSRRHAQLTTDGVRWFVEDLDSSNGSFVGPASGPLPESPVPRSTRVELGDDDRLYVGAWTRIVVRRAAAAERAL